MLRPGPRTGGDDLTRDGRILELDGLRGLAILSVVLFHYTAFEGSVPPGTLASVIQRLLMMGWTGVDLFFVLSGFLIGGILIDVRGSPNYFRTFYARRFFRIVPIYYLWIASYLLLMLLAGPSIQARSFSGREPITGFAIYEHFAFVQNIWIATLPGIAGAWFAHTWSLAVEEQFYLFAPLVVRLLPPRRLRAILIAIVAATPLLRSFLLYRAGQPSWAIVVATPCRSDGLALGMLAALCWRDPAARAWLSSHIRTIYAALCALGGGAVFLWVHSPQSGTVMMQTVGFTWMACFYLTILAATLASPTGPLARWMRVRWLRELGRVSYCVYIIHLVVDTLCHALLLHSRPVISTSRGLAVTALAGVVSYGVARLSWRLVERPLLKRGHQFAYFGDASALPPLEAVGKPVV
jgi:peptidoglycan/LPS O-acetylase OafA/YrhL